MRKRKEENAVAEWVGSERRAKQNGTERGKEGGMKDRQSQTVWVLGEAGRTQPDRRFTGIEGRATEE